MHKAKPDKFSNRDALKQRNCLKQLLFKFDSEEVAKRLKKCPGVGIDWDTHVDIVNLLGEERNKE
jgi:hypothetical protein